MLPGGPGRHKKGVTPVEVGPVRRAEAGEV
jgi:hypothetical protein